MMNRNIGDTNEAQEAQSMKSLFAAWSKVSQTIYVETSAEKGVPLDKSDKFPDSAVTAVSMRCALTGMCLAVGYVSGTCTQVALSEALACMAFPKIPHGELIRPENFNDK